MIEKEEVLMNITRTHLPSLTDCSHITDSAANCYDYPRTELLIDDPQDWFTKRYNKNSNPSSTDALFDVIITKASKTSSLSDYLAYLYAALSPEGVIAIRTGPHPDFHTPPSQHEDSTTGEYRHETLTALERHPETAAVLI